MKLMARTIIFPDPPNKGLFSEVEHLESFLEKGERAVTKLPFGCLLRVEKTSRESSTKILQIFLDPLRFNKWISSLEKSKFFYVNLCGLELVKHKTGRWALYLDEQELLLDIKAQEPYELATLEIDKEITGEKIIRRIR